MWDVHREEPGTWKSFHGDVEGSEALSSGEEAEDNKIAVVNIKNMWMKEQTFMSLRR